jgi:hypothetical protein
LIAAQSCNRVCVALEITPLFVDLAIRRWQAFTGEKATRESDGVYFDSLLPTTHLQKRDSSSSLDQTF